MSEPYDARHDPSSADQPALATDSMVARRVGPLAVCGRLDVELQLLGVLAIVWLLVCAHALAWVRATADASAPIDGLLLARLAVPQFIALAVVAMRTLLDLPATRWDRRGSFVRRRWPWAFAITCPLLVPIALVMLARDRSARAQHWSDEQLQGAHVRLLRLPAATALRMLAWASLAFAVDMLLLASERDLSRTGVITLAVVCIGAVGPAAVILLGWARAVLRPEVLTAPLAATPRRTFDVGMRLQLQLVVAGLGACAALTAAGVVWSAADGSVVVVPMPTTPPVQPTALFVVAALAATVLVAVSLALARDTQRDVVRATAQVAAVADGRAPPPLVVHSLSTRELQHLVRSVDRLVARITESNVEKYVAIEKAKEADRLKSQFLANMSHDLRSPLNSILGFSELLLSGIDGPLVAEQREIVDTIHTSGRELLQQIDDILDTAKIDAGRLELHPEPNPVATLVTRAVQNAQKRAPLGVRFVVDAEAGLPPAFVDPYRTVQALENVLVFASVKLQNAEVTVRVQLATSGRRRVIAVEVRTPVAPASAAQLAEARRGFHRIPGHRGLGLSLPIAGSILELQGGSLSIRESTHGMAFRIELRSLETRRPTSPGRGRSEA